MATTPNIRAALAAVIADYRAGEIATPDAAHVERWISQFPATVRGPILTELLYVFGRTYFTRANVQTFIDSIVTNASFAGPDPSRFWQGVKVLNLQTAGNSQKDMIALLAESLRRQCGVGLESCGGAMPHTFLYLDDALFSGGRIETDMTAWITDVAPTTANVVILVIASHAFGQWSTARDLQKVAERAGKTITISWRRCASFENRKTYIANSDILSPAALPDDPATRAYAAGLGREPLIRPVGGTSPIGVFSGEAGRNLLEQNFLTAGVRVKAMCPNFDRYMRPLGRILFDSFGFGSTIVTYRNCPNNAPLVFWAGDPWYPLFPRKTN